MIYLLSLRKYAAVFLKVFLAFAGALALYFVIFLLYLKFRGNSSILVEALRNYGTMLLYSIPFMVIVSGFLYFSFSSAPDRRFLIIMVPLVALFNTLLLFVFFFVNTDFADLVKPEAMFAYPELKEGYITPIGDYKIWLAPGYSNSVRKGILFYKNGYFLDSVRIQPSEINLTSPETIGNGGPERSWVSFSVPKKDQVVELPNTSVGSALLDIYIHYVKRLKTIFQTTFVTNGLAASILSMLLLAVGFFAIVAGAATWFNEKSIFLMTVCTLVVLSSVMFLAFPQFLSLIELIKFGIKNGFWKVFIPSLFVGGLAALIGLGLIELRQLTMKRGTGSARG